MAGRIEDVVVDSLALEEPMQPEAVVADLMAAVDLDLVEPGRDELAPGPVE
jgi:hypothetical protein